MRQDDLRALEKASKEAKETKSVGNNAQEQPSQSFLGALLTKILDNIQVEIFNVHIRYEAGHEDPWVSVPYIIHRSYVQHPDISIGICIEHLSILSTDPNFSPSFVNEPHSIIYKVSCVSNNLLIAPQLVRLKNLSLYANPRDEQLLFESAQDMCIKMRDWILRDKEMSKGKAQYLIEPLSSALKVTVNKHPNKATRSIPVLSVELLVDTEVITLSEEQYQNIMDLINYLLMISERWKYRMFRPKVRPKDDPIAWWKYAGI